MCKLIASLITICICAQAFPSPEDYKVKKDGDKDKSKEVIIRKNDDVERVRRYVELSSGIWHFMVRFGCFILKGGFLRKWLGTARLN